MECIENICYCENGYIPENEHCIDSKEASIAFSHNQKRYAINPCKTKPCFMGNYCENINNSQFICLCSLGRFGNLCEKSYNSILFPSFRHKSFLELNPIELNLEDFVIDIEFKPDRLDGTLINFIQAETKSTDFLTIFLNNGKIKLAIYQSGIGFEMSEISTRVLIGRFYKLFIKMRKNFLLIQLDNQFPLTKKTSIKVWNKMNRLILGNIDHFESIRQKMADLNITDNFHGCIQYLKLKNQLMNLSFPSRDIKNGANIEECLENQCLNTDCFFGRCRLINYFDGTIKPECICKRGYTDKNCQKKIDPCSNSPCYYSNITTCVPTSIGSFECICPDGLDGKLCEKLTKNKAPFVAKFSGKSFIEKPSLGYDINLIELIFYSNKSDGLLFYNRGFEKEQFVGAKIENGFFYFVISIGRFNEIIISRTPIISNQWNKFRIIKQNSRFKVMFNFDKEITSNFKYDFNFNLTDSLFIGGVKDQYNVNKKFKITSGLNGAIQKASFNKLFDTDIRQDAILLSGIVGYNGYPCNVTCQNNGVCIPKFNSFKCKCLEGFTGKFCQRVNGRKIRNNVEATKNITRPIYFDGSTEMIFKKISHNIDEINSLRKLDVVFKPRSPNGLIFFTGNEQFNSYLYIALVNGRLEYSFSLPNQKKAFNFQTEKKLNLKNWSSVKIERNHHRTILSINNKFILNKTFDEINYIGYGSLITDGYVRLGGYRKLPFELSKILKVGFQGCIKDFKIDGDTINLIEKNLNSNFYPNFCSI